MTIHSSYWVIKEYDTSEGRMHLLVATPQIGMLNALLHVARKWSRAEVTIKELTEDYWEATSDEGKYTYKVYRQYAQPLIPEGKRFVIREERPLSLQREPGKAMPPVLNFPKPKQLDLL